MPVARLGTDLAGLIHCVIFDDIGGDLKTNSAVSSHITMSFQRVCDSLVVPVSSPNVVELGYM